MRQPGTVAGAGAAGGVGGQEELTCVACHANHIIGLQACMLCCLHRFNPETSSEITVLWSHSSQAAQTRPSLPSELLTRQQANQLRNSIKRHLFPAAHRALQGVQRAATSASVRPFSRRMSRMRLIIAVLLSWT